ncbi:MAG TPA: TetR/AcrR family transcriptional regulator C-terminal domain-containing protein [Actinoplanes sp.]|nr:TetR/AcrR family transcriptional regulator C-terminal domain-containing protein [Actinoplanes sp.]
MKGLTRDVLIETGLRLLDEVGLDGLTVRRLATALGVQSPALYWHIKTKQDLLDGMASAIIAGAGIGPPRDGEPWPEWLGRRARAYRNSLLAHRDGARLVASARRIPEVVGSFEEELAAMVKLGFTPVLALRTITVISNYINGLVLQEQTITPASPATSEAAGPRNGSAATDAGAGADRPAGFAFEALPTLAAALQEGGAPLGDAVFEHGLAVFIGGTEALLSSANSRRSPHR